MRVRGLVRAFGVATFPLLVVASCGKFDTAADDSDDAATDAAVTETSAVDQSASGETGESSDTGAPPDTGPSDTGPSDTGIDTSSPFIDGGLPDVLTTASDSGTGSSDAASDAGSGIDSGPQDAGTDAMCDPTKPFGPVVLITSLGTTGREDYMRLSPDGQTVYFATVQDGGYLDGGESNDLKDIFVGGRFGDGGPFVSVGPVPMINSAGNDDVPSVTGDGETIYFSSDRDGGPGSFDIYQAKKSGGGFASPTSVGSLGAVNTAASEGAPFISEDGTVLYFARLESPGHHHLLRATRSLTVFVSSSEVSELNVADEQYATVTPDDRVIYYSSGNTASDGGLEGDIWVASRATVGAAFTGMRRVSEVSSPDVDLPSFVTADRCNLYFTRRIMNDAGVETSKKMFVATKTPGN